jgi:hypothetical protein
VVTHSSHFAPHREVSWADEGLAQHRLPYPYTVGRSSVNFFIREIAEVIDFLARKCYYVRKESRES